MVNSAQSAMTETTEMTASEMTAYARCSRRLVRATITTAVSVKTPTKAETVIRTTRHVILMNKVMRTSEG